MVLKSKTDQLINSIREKILSGEYGTGNRIPSERKLEIEFGISRIVVRAALEKLRQEKVICKKSKSGAFVTNNAVKVINRKYRSSKGKKIKVGLVLHHRWSRDSFFTELAEKIINVANNELDLNIYFHHFFKLEVYQKDGIRILLTDHGYTDEELNVFAKSPLETIVLFRNRESGNFINLDLFDNGYQIGKYLAAKGHKNILYFEYIPRAGEFMEKNEGLRKSAIDYGLETVKVPISTNPDYGLSNITSAMDYALTLKDKFTAIMAPDDIKAYEIIDFLQTKKIKVPENVSLIGNGDFYFSSYPALALTTIKNPIREIALCLYNAIIQYKKTGKLEIKEKIKSRIVERYTVAEI